jgi:hypothetical protein
VLKCKGLLGDCILAQAVAVVMEHRREGVRPPTNNPRRIELRDAKMWRRETERHLRSGNRRSRCPCTLCLFGRPLLRTTQAKHLRNYGRHPMKRLQDEVHPLMQNIFVWFRMQIDVVVCGDSGVC